MKTRTIISMLILVLFISCTHKKISEDHKTTKATDRYSPSSMEYMKEGVLAEQVEKMTPLIFSVKYFEQLTKEKNQQKINDPNERKVLSCLKSRPTNKRFRQILSKELESLTLKDPVFYVMAWNSQDPLLKNKVAKLIEKRIQGKDANFKLSCDEIYSDADLKPNEKGQEICGPDTKITLQDRAKYFYNLISKQMYIPATDLGPLSKVKYDFSKNVTEDNRCQFQVEDVPRNTINKIIDLYTNKDKTVGNLETSFALLNRYDAVAPQYIDFLVSQLEQLTSGANAHKTHGLLLMGTLLENKKLETKALEILTNRIQGHDELFNKEHGRNHKTITDRINYYFYALNSAIVANPQLKPHAPEVGQLFAKLKFDYAHLKYQTESLLKTNSEDMKRAAEAYISVRKGKQYLDSLIATIKKQEDNTKQ